MFDLTAPLHYTLTTFVKCGELVAHTKQALLEPLVGSQGMPFYSEYVWNGCTLHIIPHDLKRRMLSRNIPFYNGTPILFDLVLKVPKGVQLTDDILYTWVLSFKGKDDEQPRQGTGIIPINAIQAATGLMNFSDNGLAYIRHVHDIVFTLRSAIDAGRLLGELGRYELRLTVNDNHSTSKEWVATQFDLQSIDDFGVRYVDILLVAAWGVIGGLVGGFIAAIIYSWLNTR